MERGLVGLASGVLFGLGLALSGMAQPAKVIGFLDVAGAWDPSLGLVMGGAIGVYAPLYQWIRRRSVPRYADQFVITTKRSVDASLLGGSAIFGVGWGLAGYCPGPGIVSAGSGAPQGAVFLTAMLGGMFLFQVINRPPLEQLPPAGLAPPVGDTPPTP